MKNNFVISFDHSSKDYLGAILLNGEKVFPSERTLSDAKAIITKPFVKLAKKFSEKNGSNLAEISGKIRKMKLDSKTKAILCIVLGIYLCEKSANIKRAVLHEYMTDKRIDKNHSFFAEKVMNEALKNKSNKKNAHFIAAISFGHMQALLAFFEKILGHAKNHDCDKCPKRDKCPVMNCKASDFPEVKAN